MKGFALALIAASCFAETHPSKRVFIEERTVTIHSPSQLHCDTSGESTDCSTVGGHTRERNVSAEATRTFAKSCPAMSVTDNKDAADYVLKISQGSSILYKRDGDVAYISPAKTFRNMVKDVCKYVSTN